MRFALGTFPGDPSSTPGACRSCGVGRLRAADESPSGAAETGVVVTDWWIDMEGVIVLCEACAAEIGRLVPSTEKDELLSLLQKSETRCGALAEKLTAAYDIVKSQRAELTLVYEDLADLRAHRDEVAQSALLSQAAADLGPAPKRRR